jgi:hypothetical protein
MSSSSTCSCSTTATTPRARSPTSAGNGSAPVHARFYRFGEKPRIPARVDEAKIIDYASMSRIMANVQLLGKPVNDGGVGDEQAMRILLLVATTGRRLSEILLLDRDPLLPILSSPQAEDGEGSWPSCATSRPRSRTGRTRS